MDKEVEISTGALAVDTGNVVIKTSGIGSCIVVALYDDRAKIGGMAHSMLPTSGEPAKDALEAAKQNTTVGDVEAKYVNLAVDTLVSQIVKLGGKKENIKAKLIGGAKMFKILSGDNFGIGYKNIEAAKKELEKLHIAIDSEEVGGTVGRSVEFDLSNGLVSVATKM